MTSKIIFCPKCNGPIRVGKHLSFQYQRGLPTLKLSSELMNALGTGYFQQKFASTCTKPTCTFGEVTKEMLAMRKLANDVAKKADTDHVDASSHLAYVSIHGSYIRRIITYKVPQWQLLHFQCARWRQSEQIQTPGV